MMSDRSRAGGWTVPRHGFSTKRCLWHFPLKHRHRRAALWVAAMGKFASEQRHGESRLTPSAPQPSLARGAAGFGGKSSGLGWTVSPSQDLCTWALARTSYPSWRTNKGADLVGLGCPKVVVLRGRLCGHFPRHSRNVEQEVSEELHRAEPGGQRKGRHGFRERGGGGEGSAWPSKAHSQTRTPGSHSLNATPG